MTSNLITTNVLFTIIDISRPSITCLGSLLLSCNIAMNTNLLLLLLLVRLHNQSSSSDEVGGLLQGLQAP